MRNFRRAFLVAVAFALAAAAAPSGCSDGTSELAGSSSVSGSGSGGAHKPDGGATGAGGATTSVASTGNGGSTASTAATGAGGMASTGTSTSAGTGGGGAVLCPTTFSYTPPVGAQNIRVAGEWQGFDLATAPVMSGPDANGAYSAVVALPIGLQAYKLVYDAQAMTQWVLDPGQGRRKYVNMLENSAMKVRDCRLPSFAVATSKAVRPAPGSGSYAAELTYQDGIDKSGPDAAGFAATLDHDGASKPLAPAELQVDPATGKVTIAVKGLADGKYRIEVTGKAKNGKTSDPLRLIFWVEAEDFSWQDAIIYMAVTDRFRDGDPSNNPPPTAGADPRGDWMGGDFEGLRLAIEAGTLDKLGVRAIWMTPFHTNPKTAYPASDGVHQVTGYHGYWPIKAREAEPRLGGDAALHALVKAAHAHGIRILQDFVMNHIHQEHEYFAAHPDWFRTGCVCGTANCDWTVHALDCLFATYLPDVNHTVPEATAAFVADAVYWLETFDLDGLRVDAVKHVEEAATRNLAAEVRETFEPAGTRHFIMGETAMGWSDCPDPCNDTNYGTISKYIGPLGLDGQFDFVLYHGVSYRTFAYGDKGMLHADYWFNHGMQKWPAGAIMTPYIGSHDTARFTTLADYRGQDAAHDRGIPGNQWSNTAVAPTDGEPFWRTRVGMAWLLGLPGAPLLYYGDEYGQWGGSDPNNRLMWAPEANLDANQTATLAFVRKLGTARKAIPALRRGAYVTLSVNEDTLVYGRKVPAGQAAMVSLTRAPTAQSVTIDVAATLGFAGGMTLHDALGGPDVTVSPGGKATFTIPPRSAVILAP